MHAYRDQYAQVFDNGRGVILIASSADPVEELASWARDDEFPFLMASVRNTEVGRKYGALRSPDSDMTSRTVYVIGPDGRIAYRAAPFNEVDPTAYENLDAAIERVLPEEAADDEGV